MIGAILGRLASPLVPWATLGAVCVAGYLCIGHLNDEVEQARADVRDAEQAASVASTALAVQRQQYDGLVHALEHRADVMDSNRKDYDRQRQQLNDMEQSDDSDSQWLRTELPDGVAGWVRDLTATPGADGRQLSDRAGLSAGAPVGTNADQQ